MEHDLPSRHWGIVGGGMLGLTLAHRLVQHGQRVTVFESAPEFGGLASAWQVGDVAWDRHYHVTLLSDSAWRGLLSELDLDREFAWVETKTGFYTDGRLHSMSNSLEFLRFPPLGLIDKFRLAGTILHASRVTNWKQLEQIPVADWLRKLSGRRTFEKIWLPLLRAKLGDNYERTSAAFIWATIARMYAARRTGLKKEMFGYIPGGYARILDRFTEALRGAGVELCPGRRIATVRSLRSGPEAIFQDGSARRFDHIVLTAPAPAVAQICPQLTVAEKARLNGVEYQGILCASLLLDQPLAKYYVTNITDAGVPFTAVIEMSALVDRREFGGRSLVYIPKYLAADDPAWQWTDAEFQARITASLARMYPHFRPEQVQACRVSRVKHVMPIPTLGYSERVPPVETSLPGVYAVNSSQIVNGTLNVNETVKLAEQAFERVLLPSLLGDVTQESPFAELNRVP